MIKIIIIVMVLLGLLCYALIIASARAEDRDAYMAYEAYKKRQKEERHTDCPWK